MGTGACEKHVPAQLRRRLAGEEPPRSDVGVLPPDGDAVTSAWAAWVARKRSLGLTEQSDTKRQATLTSRISARQVACNCQ